MTSPIDAEKLEEAIAQAQNHGRGFHGLGGGYWVSLPTHVLYTLIEAARTLLPREITIECWAAVGDDGTVSDVCSEKEPMDAIARINSGITVVRLTGTAKVKVTR